MNYFNLNLFKRLFKKNNSSDLTRSSDGSISIENQIIFNEINKLVKNDFDNIYEKLDNIHNKIKNIDIVVSNIQDYSLSLNEKFIITDNKIQSIKESIVQLVIETRKSEEIVLINN